MCLGTVGVSFVFDNLRGPLSRSGVSRLDPGDLLGQRMILAIFLGNGSSRFCPILAQSGQPDHSKGRSGGHLWSCPSGPTSLISRATSRLPCVALASRTAHPVRGALLRSGRGRPVTLAGVMRWCAKATIITVGEATSVDAPSCSVAGLARAALSLCQGSCNLCPRCKIRRAGVTEPARGLSWPTRLSGGAAYF